MTYSIKNKDELKDLDELDNLQSKVKQVRLVQKLGKQCYYYNKKELFEPIKDDSEDVTGTMIESSKENNKALKSLNNKLLEILNDRGIIASYLLSPLSKIINPENVTQFKLVEDRNSNRVNDLLTHNKIPVTLHIDFLTLRDTNREFNLEGDILKMITNENYIADLASLSDKKLIYDFATKMHFDKKASGNKNTRDRTLIKLLKSPGLMSSVSGISNTIFLSSNLDELCNRLKLLIQEKQAGKKSAIIIEEMVVKPDKLS